MNKNAQEVKEKLKSAIKKLSANAEKYVRNPGKDFKRKRKLPFENVEELLISMGGKSIYKELLETQVFLLCRFSAI